MEFNIRKSEKKDLPAILELIKELAHLRRNRKQWRWTYKNWRRKVWETTAFHLFCG
jgi:N-acetylglutamate synthase-like GNAT family acetyltransferase